MKVDSSYIERERSNYTIGKPFLKHFYRDILRTYKQLFNKYFIIFFHSFNVALWKQKKNCIQYGSLTKHRPSINVDTCEFVSRHQKMKTISKALRPHTTLRAAITTMANPAERESTFYWLIRDETFV